MDVIGVRALVSSSSTGPIVGFGVRTLASLVSSVAIVIFGVRGLFSTLDVVSRTLHDCSGSGLGKIRSVT